MAVQTDVEGVQAAWRALAVGHDGEGWRTIPVSTSVPCLVLAGRHLPRGEEALLLGFRNAGRIPDSVLPQGHGFEVSRLPTDPTGAGRSCFALTRREGGSLELFAMMAEDLIHLLESAGSNTEDLILQRFLARIRAWQNFMERHRGSVLSPETEVGLFGELIVLEQLLDTGIPAVAAIDAWQGPLDGLQDFIFGSGGIEVKTTVSTGGFPATVGTLEQLDETLRYPLFIAGVRLSVEASGMSLPAMADVLRVKLSGEPTALDALETKLIRAGLLHSSNERYERHFTHASTSIFPVAKDFPRLTRCNVNPAIRKVRYEIDLSLVERTSVDLVSALEQLGAI